ncbi:proton-dependent oligopeptide transporter family protein [Tanacetum coccineum]
MIHLVIHLPLEALEGGPIRPRWMFPFERYMKKLKGYDVTTKFNRPDRNVDPPPPTCQFQVFRSLCKSIGLRSVIRFDAQELKKVIWYVLHNSPEIDTYRSQFKSKFPNKDMKEEFPDWFGSLIRQRHVDNDPGVSATSELFALACGPTPTPISVNSCVVNGVRFVVHNQDERHITQNSGICSPGGKDGEMYYGQLQEILKFLYLSFKVVLFLQSKSALRNHLRHPPRTRITSKPSCHTFAPITTHDHSNLDKRERRLKMINTFSQHKSNNASTLKIWPDDNPTRSLNDLDNATLHIDGQSMEVDAPPNIINLDEDNDIIDDEDALPHDLADSDDEDLVNVDDDDGVDVVYSSEEED